MVRLLIAESSGSNLPIILIAAAVLIGGAVFSLLRSKKIKENGIEAAAVVSRIEVERDHSAEPGSSNETEKFYVNYVNAEGNTIEAVLGNPPAGCRVGTEMKIKYLPEKPKFVVRVKE